MSSGNEKSPRNPLLAVDCIVRLPEGLLLIERANPPAGWALPGGFVEYGETVEEAVRREIFEETGVELQTLRQWRVFSDPNRDPRQHVVSVVFHADSEGDPAPASDARDVRVFPFDDKWPDCVFDHNKILAQAQAEDIV